MVAQGVHAKRGKPWERNILKLAVQLRWLSKHNRIMDRNAPYVNEPIRQAAQPTCYQSRQTVLYTNKQNSMDQLYFPESRTYKS